MSKKTLGQFFTTNYEYIMQNMKIPKYVKTIIEPFAGNGDMLKFVDSNVYKSELYDIDPKVKNTKKKDTLKDPPNYKNKFIITNPPYLARNKSANKEIFDKYNLNDLYKCFIKSIVNDECLGGIIIVPLNFWCSIRVSDINLRKEFLAKYNIIHINIFEERVFDDTSYTVCCFQFELLQDRLILETPVTFYPENKNILVWFSEKNSFTFGGEIYNLPEQKEYTIKRLLSDKEKSTNILVKCIDDSLTSMIRMEYTNKKFIDDTAKKTARSYMTLVIEPSISANKQKILVALFNKFLNSKRKKYKSLFLTNYRESNTIARKRISFDLVYKIVGYILTCEKYSKYFG